MPVECFENRTQKAVHHDSAGGNHVNDAYASFGRDRAKNVAAAGSVGRDLSACAFQVLRIEHVDGNVLVDGRKQSGGMQDLGSEVRQFGGFIEADLFDGLSLRAQARVGGHHAFDVGPYLNALCIESSADDCRRIIGAASAECGGHAFRAGRNESAHHWNSFFRKQRHDLLLGFLARFCHLRIRLRMFGVGDQTGARIHPGRVQSANCECIGYDQTGE